MIMMFMVLVVCVRDVCSCVRSFSWRAHARGVSAYAYARSVFVLRARARGVYLWRVLVACSWRVLVCGVLVTCARALLSRLVLTLVVYSWCVRVLVIVVFACPWSWCARDVYSCSWCACVV